MGLFVLSCWIKKSLSASPRSLDIQSSALNLCELLEAGKGKGLESLHLHPCCIEVVVLDTQKDVPERKRVESFLGGLGFTRGKGLCSSPGPSINE